jgi:hypothetical protein
MVKTAQLNFTQEIIEIPAQKYLKSVKNQPVLAEMKIYEF